METLSQQQIKIYFWGDETPFRDTSRGAKKCSALKSIPWLFTSSLQKGSAKAMSPRLCRGLWRNVAANCTVKFSVVKAEGHGSLP
jgi:hypothetical protein